MDHKIEIYTDGACSQNGTWDGGFGVVVVKEGKIIHALGDKEKHTTNNIMEMKAIIMAIDFLAMERDKISVHDKIEAYIYTDSAYIVNCINEKWYVNWQKNGWVTSKKEPVKNKLLWVDILSFLKYNDWVQIIKVKGHSDNEYNNMADKLAVQYRIAASKEVE